jgi:hypothetical protein
MFKKINLMDNSVKVPSNKFSEAINSGKEFGITPAGEVKFAPFETKEILIYKGQVAKNLVSQKVDFRKILGEGYRVKATFTQTEIYVDSWEKIIDLNTKISLYEDSSSEGVDSFLDEKIEEISWHSVEFDIKSREIVEIIEESVNGILLCFERDMGEHYTFSGIGFILDESELLKAQKVVLDKVKNLILEKIDTEKDEFQKYGFSDEQQEALEFFGLNIKI